MIEVPLGTLTKGAYFFRPGCGCVCQVGTVTISNSYANTIRVVCVVPCATYHADRNYGYEERWSWEPVDVDPLRLAMALECA